MRAIRIGFHVNDAVGAAYAELVYVVDLYAVDSGFPDAAAYALHGRGGAVPAVKLTNHGNALRVGRPYPETPGAVAHIRGTHQPERVRIRTFVKQINRVLQFFVCFFRFNFLVRHRHSLESRIFPIVFLSRAFPERQSGAHAFRDRTKALYSPSPNPSS